MLFGRDCAKIFRKGGGDMTLEEIKLRRLAGQHLTDKSDAAAVLHDLCGIQAQMMSYAEHSLGIRCIDAPEYLDGFSAKSWTLRGTMHIFVLDDLPLFLHDGRTHYLRECDMFGADGNISTERKQYFADAILQSISGGADTRDELKARCFELGMTEREAESIFNSWGGTIRALCEAGKICGRVSREKAYKLCPELTPMDESSAWLELTRRYFTHYGPATLRDAAYFFGVPQAKIKQYLPLLDIKAAEYGGRSYYYIEDGSIEPREMPECIFLGGFDQLMLGYEKRESLYLPQEHLRGIFSLAGIVSPAVLLRGTVAGKWNYKGKTLTVTQFGELSERDKRAIFAQAGIQWPSVSKIVFI